MPVHLSIGPLAAIAASQGGLLSADQILTCWSRSTMTRRVRDGELLVVRRGVYRLAGAPPSVHLDLRAACLAAGTYVAASHRSAARLHRLAGITAAGVELTGHVDRHVQGPNVLVHRSTDLRDGDVMFIRGIPVTTAVRTLLDLGAVVRTQWLEQALDDALRRQLCSLADIERRFNEIARRGRDGIGVLRPLLEERLGTSMAPSTGFEQRMIRILRTIDLPEPVRQHRVDFAGGGYGFVDLSWPDIRLAVECDDLASHFAAHALRWDDHRQNELVLLGWTVLRFTFEDVVRRPHSTGQTLLEGYRRCSARKSA